MAKGEENWQRVECVIASSGMCAFSTMYKHSFTMGDVNHGAIKLTASAFK